MDNELVHDLVKNDKTAILIFLQGGGYVENVKVVKNGRNPKVKVTK